LSAFRKEKGEKSAGTYPSIPPADYKTCAPFVSIVQWKKRFFNFLGANRL
jgi:hypothetical protein